MNVLNGGVHADNPVDFPEFMVARLGASSFAHAVQIVPRSTTRWSWRPASGRSRPARQLAQNAWRSTTS
jgi:hypothetical protein